MITEDYVSFETAKLLKEKGFDEACHAYYDGGHRHLLKFVQNGLYNNAGVVANSGICVGPTLQMAMKWLREVHKVDITVDPHEVGNDWIYQFHICQNKDYLFSRDIDTSYENCAEAAIRYCLENLI